ncbi:MAG: LuxR C-terminal-related transcriptional regulator [Flexilinea sp.]
MSGLDQPGAWLSLDSSDDEPGRFFSYLIAALQKIDPGLGREIECLLRAGQLPPVEIISATLINDLLAHSGRFILVLDDVHLIRQGFILQVLEKLVANLPPALHLVLLTREDPTLPLARLRANNQMTEIRAAELRFTPAEAARFLNEGMGLCLSQADITALEERTEGWIVGLQLAGLSVRDRPDPSRFISTLSGSHRHILSYLTEEVLNRQPEKVQRFLLQTSILDRLSGGLCDAVTESSGSHALLEQLCNANLFLVPLDDEQHWYRYHHLFAELLRARLNQYPKDKESELHQRASRWYAQASTEPLRPDERAAFASEAVQHALAARDYETAVGLIETSAMSLIMQWYATTVNGWVQALPPEWRMKSPKTNLAFAWHHLLHGDFTQAAPYLEQLGSVFAGSEFGNEPSTRSEWLALQAWLLNAQGKPAQGLALAGQALQSVPEADGYTRSLIYMAMAGAYQQLDDYPQAVEAYQKLISYGTTAGNITSELLGIVALGQIALFHGQYRYTFEIASQGVEHMERSGSLHPISTALYGELAEIHYQWNQLEQARRDILRAVQVSTLSGYSHAAVYYSVLLSRLFQREGDLEAAIREIQKTGPLIRAESGGFLKEEAVAQQVRLDLIQDRLTDAEAAFAALRAGSEGQPVSPQVKLPLSNLPVDQAITYQVGRIYNIALRLHLYRARIEGDRAGLAQGIEFANGLFDRMIQSGYLPVALETLLLRAQLQAVSGNMQASLADITCALDLGEPEGIISMFVEEGQPITNTLALLLERNRLSPVLASYIRRILAAFPNAGLQPKSPLEPASMIEPLTERELDVLRLIADGLKYEQIAGRLYISLNTVRTYVKGIYGKLYVNNRTAAITQARQNKLI